MEEDWELDDLFGEPDLTRRPRTPDLPTVSQSLAPPATATATSRPSRRTEDTPRTTATTGTAGTTATLDVTARKPTRPQKVVDGVPVSCIRNPPVARELADS